LHQLIDYLISLYPEIASHLLDEHANLRSDVPIFVNGRNPRLKEVGFDQGLGSEDVISIFSPIASGRMNVESMRDAPTDEKE
jgi:molybdopterin converting factor small subunit